MGINNNKKDFFNKNLVYAIVGASNNENKYGYKIFKALLKAKFNVFPVNPKEKEILGQKCYKSLAEVPKEIDVVNFVVPPNVTLKILEDDVLELGIEKVWFQHGSFNENCKIFCKENKIIYIDDLCLLETTIGGGKSKSE